MVYGYPKGICTKDKKEDFIKDWAEKEFDDDLDEARDQLEFEEFELNKLTNE
jgi:hypothetical protein